MEKYIDSEVLLAREFCGKEPRQFFELVAQHTMYSQQYLHREFFREIAGGIACGDYSRLLVHMNSQVRRIMDVFIEKFPQYDGRISISRGQGMLWAVGTFILVRNYDDGLGLVTEDQLVDLIVDAYGSCVEGAL